MGDEATPLPGASVPRAVDLERALADGLDEHFPGLEIVDRALVISSGGERAPLRADFLAIDTCDRILLIALVDGRSEATVLDAFDALALLRESRDLLVEHLRSPRARAGTAPMLVLVAEQFAERVERGLATVAPLELRLFELREVSSAHGSRAFLAPARAARRGANASGASSARSSANAPNDSIAPPAASRTSTSDRSRASAEHGSFSERGNFSRRRSVAQRGSLIDLLDLAPPSVQAAAEVCVARVDRVDSDLVRRSGFDLVSWRYRTQRLCSIVWTGERLCGLVEDHDGDFPLENAAEIEAFVDRVVAEHLRRIERDEPISRPESPGESDRGDSIAADRGVLLTPEEIAAFRD